jgi:hypothetical protein
MRRARWPGDRRGRMNLDRIAWAYPALEALHVLGIAMLFGSLLGFGLCALTGRSMFAGQAGALPVAAIGRGEPQLVVLAPSAQALDLGFQCGRGRPERGGGSGTQALAASAAARPREPWGSSSQRRLMSWAPAGSSSYQAEPLSSSRRSTSISRCQRWSSTSTRTPRGPMTCQLAAAPARQAPRAAASARDAWLGLPKTCWCHAAEWARTCAVLPPRLDLRLARLGRYWCSTRESKTAARQAFRPTLVSTAFCCAIPPLRNACGFGANSSQRRGGCSCSPGPCRSS